MDVEAGTRELTRFREVIEVEYDEVTHYGCGVRCTTMPPVREPGPKVFA